MCEGVKYGKLKVCGENGFETVMCDVDMVV